MANSDLKDKKYELPPTLAKISGNKYISYHMLKKLKNFFKNNDKSHHLYNSKGGEEMKKFVESKLTSERSSLNHSKDLKSDYGLSNGHIKTHNKNNQTKNISSIGNLPKLHKSAGSKRLSKGEVLYENSDKYLIEDIYKEIERIKSLITYESKI